MAQPRRDRVRLAEITLCLVTRLWSQTRHWPAVFVLRNIIQLPHASVCPSVKWDHVTLAPSTLQCVWCCDRAWDTDKGIHKAELANRASVALLLPEPFFPADLPTPTQEWAVLRSNHMG